MLVTKQATKVKVFEGRTKVARGPHAAQGLDHTDLAGPTESEAKIQQNQTEEVLYSSRLGSNKKGIY